MSRGKTLSQLTEELRAECRKSTSTSRGIDNLENLQQVIKRVYEALYDRYDWPHLNVRRDKALSAGQRYYDFPDDLDFESIRPDSMRYQYAGSWPELEYGICSEDFVTYDSDNGDRSEPVLKWDVIDAGAGDQIEVWPIPAVDGVIRMEGKKKFEPLVEPSDKAKIDSIAIIMFAAAEILASTNQKDSQAKLAQAQDRINSLMGRFSKKKIGSMGTGYKDSVRLGPVIRVRGA